MKKPIEKDAIKTVTLSKDKTNEKKKQTKETLEKKESQRKTKHLLESDECSQCEMHQALYE